MKKLRYFILATQDEVDKLHCCYSSFGAMSSIIDGFVRPEIIGDPYKVVNCLKTHGLYPNGSPFEDEDWRENFAYVFKYDKKFKGFDMYVKFTDCYASIYIPIVIPKYYDENRYNKNLKKELKQLDKFVRKMHRDFIKDINSLCGLNIRINTHSFKNKIKWFIKKTYKKIQ